MSGALAHVRQEETKKAESMVSASMAGMMEGASKGMMGMLGGAKSAGAKAGRLKQKLMEAKEGGDSAFDAYAQFS